MEMGKQKLLLKVNHYVHGSLHKLYLVCFSPIKLYKVMICGLWWGCVLDYFLATHGAFYRVLLSRTQPGNRPVDNLLAKHKG